MSLTSWCAMDRASAPELEKISINEYGSAKEIPSHKAYSEVQSTHNVPFWRQVCYIKYVLFH